MKLEPSKMKRQDAAHLLTDTVVPRPIAWVSTMDKNGVYNLAPFSSYGMITPKPMYIYLTVGTNREGKKKDTIRNIEAMQEFVVAVVTEELAEAMNITSYPFPPDVSEFEKAKLTPVKADLVKAALVAESPVNMECRVHQIQEFGIFPALTSFIIGEVLMVHVKDEMWNEQIRRVIGLRAVARLGGDGDLYCRGQDTFVLKRPYDF